MPAYKYIVAIPDDPEMVKDLFALMEKYKVAAVPAFGFTVIQLPDDLAGTVIDPLPQPVSNWWHTLKTGDNVKVKAPKARVYTDRGHTQRGERKAGDVLRIWRDADLSDWLCVFDQGGLTLWVAGADVERAP